MCIRDRYYVVYTHHSAVTPWLPGSDIDVFVSEYLKSQYSNLMQWIRNPIVVPTGIDVRPYLTITSNKTRKDKVVVGRLSSDSKDKFPPEFLKMMEDYGGKVEIVGGGKYYKEPRVKRVKYLDFNIMHPWEYMKRWDIFVYRTNVRETWCRVIAEAMASGLPVVAENKGAIPELVVDGHTGFICDTDNEIVEKLKLLQSNHALRKKMGIAGRERIKDICLENPFACKIEPLITKHVLMG